MATRSFSSMTLSVSYGGRFMVLVHVCAVGSAFGSSCGCKFNTNVGPLGPSGIRDPMANGTSYLEVRATMDCCVDFHEAEYCLPVGIVSQVTMKRPTASTIQRAHQVTETCKSLERIEVLMRV